MQFIDNNNVTCKANVDICENILCVNVCQWKRNYSTFYSIDCISLTHLSSLVLIQHSSSAPCSGTRAQLSGTEGQFWITSHQYMDNLHCQWQIEVETGKVSSVIV